MELKYVGPKPIISHTGVEFDLNKEDKFIYIEIVIQLIKALSHEYIENRIYKYNADISPHSGDDMLNDLKKICKNLDELINKENHHIEDEIQHNLQRAQESFTLNMEEKKVLKNNIRLMHDYLVQRSVNKSVYYCAINALSELVQKDHIDYIVAPMTQPFLHVFHSLQGVLSNKKVPLDTDMQIYKENGVLLTKLKVINTN